MYLSVSTKDGIKTRSRAGFVFTSRPRIVELDAVKDAEKIRLLQKDGHPKHGGLIVQEVAAAEARRTLEARPEADANTVPPEVEAKLAAMSARMAELEQELAAALGKAKEPAEGEGGETPPADGPKGGPDRAGRERLGKR